MPPTTRTVIIDPYIVRRPHPRPNDPDAYARARAHRINSLTRREAQLADERDETVRLLQKQLTTEQLAIHQQLLVEVREITEDVDIIHAQPGDPIAFEGPDEATIRCALLGTRHALARAQRQLDIADTAALDAISTLTAEVDYQLQQMAAARLALDYGIPRGGAA